MWSRYFVVFPCFLCLCIGLAKAQTTLPPTWATHRAHVQHLRKQRQKKSLFSAQAAPMGMRGSWEDLLELLQNFGRFLF